MASDSEPNAYTLAELARLVGATLDGDGAIRIARVATLERAGTGDIAFLANPRYRAQLATTHAAAVIVSPDAASATPRAKLISTNPYAAFARVAAILHRAPRVEPGLHPTACVDPSARVAGSAAVGPFAVIGAQASVGERSQIGAHSLRLLGSGCRRSDPLRRNTTRCTGHAAPVEPFAPS